MSNRDQRWQVVGQAISDRIRALSLTKAEVIRRSGVSDKTLNAYLAGEPIKRRDKARDLCRALNWPDNAIDLIIEGHDPRLIDIEGPSNDGLAGAIVRHDEELEALRREIKELREQLDASRATGRASR